jgi:predicted Fe-S protein YdhL (DUF1289 family)
MEEDVISGCIGVCSTLFDEVCKGCGRTASEVDGWVFMTREEKLAAVERARKVPGTISFLRLQNLPI